MLLEYLCWELINIVLSSLSNDADKYIPEAGYILLAKELEKHHYEVNHKLLLNCVFVNY